MTVDLTKLSDSILQETEDYRLKQEIRNNSGEIARQLRTSGVYVNLRSGLRIALQKAKKTT